MLSVATMGITHCGNEFLKFLKQGQLMRRESTGLKFLIRHSFWLFFTFKVLQNLPDFVTKETTLKGYSFISTFVLANNLHFIKFRCSRYKLQICNSYFVLALCLIHEFVLVGSTFFCHSWKEQQHLVKGWIELTATMQTTLSSKRKELSTT